MLNEELIEMIDLSKRFMKNEIEEGALEADLNRDDKWLLKIWEKSAEIGYPNLVIPEEYGGVGQSDLCAGLVLDAFASGCAGIASLFAGHFAACRCISMADDLIKRKYLAAIAETGVRKDGIAALVLPSNYDDTQLKIIRKDGGIFVNGASGLTLGAGIARYFCVFCNDEENKNIICFIAERGAMEIVIGENPLLPGLKVNPFAPVIFDNLRISNENIISIKSKGAALLSEIREIFFGFIAALSIGTARTAYNKAHAYAEERYQYGTMIINHSEIQRMLGAMAMKLSVGESAYIEALFHDDSAIGENKNRARFAKIFCSDSAVEIAIDAIQIHGGYGYMHDYGVEKIMRDAKVLQMLGGTSPELCVQTIAGEMK
jgi:alkylation response protein AidB-like acyl-CoA dehydrogenase